MTPPSVLQHPAAAALPAAAIAGEVNRLLATHGRLVICAPPGAGKSTLLPLTMREALPEDGKILMLEPRRMAARQVADRMAWLLGEEPGGTVGYRIRFEHRTGPRTRVEVLTEGILTRMLVDDPTLEGVSAVLFDEFHERSLQTDLALALVLEAQRQVRPDLRVVLMSATLETADLCERLDAALAESDGRLFPVEERYAETDCRPEEAADEAGRAVLRACREREGDVLAFLPGEAEIRRCAERLAPALEEAGIRVCPLYGNLPDRMQREAIAPAPAGERKVVLATPIAETSLTIEGVRTVVDSGFCRKAVFDPRSGLSHFETLRISQDMARQRSGRAGRVSPGVCYRLWTAGTQQRMAATRVPEILEADLAPLVLSVAAWGESRPERLPWLTPPPADRLREARRLLELLGAVDESGAVTPQGRQMAAFPCHPRLARMLLRADNENERALAADIAALLEERDLPGIDGAGLDLRIAALRRTGKDRPNGGVWHRLRQGAEQYRRMTRAPETTDLPDPYAVGALVAAAYPERIAHARPEEGPGRFFLAGGEQVRLDTADPLSACEWLAVAHLTARPDGVGQIFLADPVAPADLRPLARTRDVVAWDSRQGGVIARRETRIGNLLLSAQPLSGDLRERQTEAICRAAMKEGRSMLDFSEEVQGLQRRIAAVARRHPELGLPDLSTDTLLQQAPQWLGPWVGTATTTAQLRKIDLCTVLWAMLSHEQQQAVETLAPSHITVPTGSRIRVEYRTGADAPVVRVRLQECFGLVDTPHIDGVPVLMELLSPGFKPVQLTSDLRSFWKDTYFQVRSELRRRYPRHAWPDDPLAADPVRGVRKKKT